MHFARIVTLAVAGILPHLMNGAETGTIVGQVVDGNSGYYLAGATMRIAETSVETVTASDGRYRLANVPEGRITLVVDYLGFEQVVRTVEVTPGQVHWQNIEMGVNVVNLDAVVVEGTRVGQARALNLQKTSPNLVNVVAADAIGKFPDQNAAEALSRMTSVTVERDRGEGRYVTIRGIDSNLNGYSVDGLALAAPRAGERAVLLDIIPSDVLQRLDVSKTVMPDQPADAIGGAIEIKTPSAFTRDGITARMTAQINYADARGDWKPHIDGAVGNVFGDQKTMGLLVAFSYDKRSLGTFAQRLTPWTPAIDPSSNEEHYFPSETQFREYIFDRTRKGVTANFEVKPDENSTYYIRGFYNEYYDTQIRQRSTIEMETDGIVELAEASGIVNVGDVDEYGNSEVELQLVRRDEQLSLWGFSAGGENHIGNVLLDYQAGYSFGNEDTSTEFAAHYILSEPTQFAYSGGASDNPEFIYTGAHHDPSNAAAYGFDEAEEEFQLVEEDHWEAALNARHDFDSTHRAFIKGGLRLRLKEKRNQYNTYISESNPPDVESLEMVADGLGEFNLYKSLPLIDPELYNTYLERRSEFAPELDFTDSTAGDWVSSEDVFGAYAMGGLTMGALEMFAGLRMERTEFETNGTQVNEAEGSSSPIRATRSRERWLPGVHLRYPFGENVVIRASYTQTVGRPGFEQSAASVIVDDDEIEAGNPDLDEMQSYNWDVSLDYFMPNSLGILSVAAFSKSLDNFIFPRISMITVDDEVFEVSSYANGERGRVRGLELGLQRQLTFMPAPFDGLGVFCNIAFVSSDATLPESIGRDDPAGLAIPFPRQSDTVGNLGLTYENGRFFVRVAAVFRSEYLDSVGDEPIEDIYVQDHLQVDLSARFRLSDEMTLFAGIVNANNEPLVERFGQSNRVRLYETYSWSAQFGLKYSR